VQVAVAVVVMVWRRIGSRTSGEADAAVTNPRIRWKESRWAI